MKKLDSAQIALCKSLGEQLAEAQVDSLISFLNRKRRLSVPELCQLIFNDWCNYAHDATCRLVKAGLIEPSNALLSGSSNGHEKLLAFRLFTESYERKTRLLIEERYRLDLVVPFHEKDSVKTLGAKWDVLRKRWFIPHDADTTQFAKWLEPPIADPLPGGLTGP